MEKNKYKDALERAKSAIKECGDNVGRIKMIESIFPELGESGEEKIRKAIIAHMNLVKSVNGVDVSDILAYLEKVKDFDEQLEQAYKNSDEVQYKRGYDDGYLEGMASAKQELEKQGEHANFLSKIQVGDKVTRNEDGVLVNLSQLNRVVKKLEKQDEQSKEVTYTHEVETGNGNIKALVTEKVQLPKFKVGDFIVNDYCMGRVVEITNDAYLLDTGQGIPFSCEHNAHLWSISDAKDGDVLYSPCCKLLWIYKDEKTCYVGSNLNYNSGSIVINKSVCIPTDVIPATKEQRDNLFKAMTDKGYTFDFEKKELNQKIVTKKSDKVEWSDEDQDFFGMLEGYLEFDYDLSMNDKANTLDWLKSIKERLQ